MPKVTWIDEWPMIVYTRLGVKPCSMNRLAAAWRSACRTYFGSSGSEIPAPVCVVPSPRR